MTNGKPKFRWLLFLPQLPAANSTARVSLWRQLKSAGATGATQGAWILPSSEASATVFARLAQTTREHGGIGLVFGCDAIEGRSDDEIIAGFRADRAREYHEFHSRTDGLLAEIEKETKLGKFMFAELEEIEGDLDKLRSWLAKIGERDFFPDERQSRASKALGACEEAFRDFAEKVYEHEQAHGPESQGV